MVALRIFSQDTNQLNTKKFEINPFFIYDKNVMFILKLLNKNRPVSAR